MEYIVDKESLLIDELKLIFPNSSNNKIRKMLSNNRISVDGVIVNKAKTKVKKGISIFISESIITYGNENKFKINIVYEDEELIVVNKPDKLLSVATNKLEKDTLHSRVVNYLKSKNKSSWGWIVHRLDRDTSGIIVFAKSEESKLKLQKQFSKQTVKRIYVAIVDGKPYSDIGKIENYIVEGRDLVVRECKKSTKGSKIAITNWKVIANNDNHTLLEIFIETGRRNQIRVHFSGIKCPISGDKKFGSNTNPFRRICLHAQEISIKHPITFEEITFSSTNPFEKLFN